jgi:cell division protein ZapA (FtsZ GTPase activity inhibitor)
MREVARLVDEKMNIVANQVRTADSYRIAVLTAIHIADELLSSRKRQDETDRQLREKSERLVALLDELEGEPHAEAFLTAAD